MIFKNHNSHYKDLIDMILIFLDSLEGVVSFLQILEFVGFIILELSIFYGEIVNLSNTPKILARYYIFTKPGCTVNLE